MKSENRKMRKALDMLKSLTELVGAYGVQTAWSYDKKIILHCDKDKLKEFLQKRDLEFNYETDFYLGFENEYMKLFYIK